MGKIARMTDEDLDRFFTKAYVEKSVPAGIMKSNRTNSSTLWDKEGDEKRGKANAASSVAAGDKAIEILTNRG